VRRRERGREGRRQAGRQAETERACEKERQCESRGGEVMGTESVWGGT